MEASRKNSLEMTDIIQKRGPKGLRSTVSEKETNGQIGEMGPCQQDLEPEESEVRNKLASFTYLDNSLDGYVNHIHKQ